MRHLLVTNDFPPKIGGIQSYLFELWRRLPADDVTVLTTPHRGSERFDAEQRFRIVRTREPVLLPNPVLARHIRAVAAESGAQAVAIDPGFPLGLVGPSLGLPYAMIIHGAEMAIPGRVPACRQIFARAMRSASLVIASGTYPEAEAIRATRARSMPRVVQVPPGVDSDRFAPVSALDRAAWRARLGLPATGPLVVSVSRLVPRKGMDTLIEAAGILSHEFPDLIVAIAGQGRDRARLERKIRSTKAPVVMLGRISAAELPNLYASADVFALCCRSRWMGLEQEGFGIVLLEAAAAGVPCVAGRSGGSADAVVDGETGLVVDNPEDPRQVASAIRRLLAAPDLAARLGAAARRRARSDFGFELLAARLGAALEAMVTTAQP